MRCRIILPVLVIVVVAACGDGADDGDDEQLPSLTFDGTSALYEGPSEVAGYPPVQTFRLVNDSDTSVDFGYSPIKPDEFEGVTEQDAIAFGLDPSNADVNPPWLGNPGHFAKHVLPGETIEATAGFVAGRSYELWVWSSASQTAHFAAWVDAVATND